MDYYDLDGRLAVSHLPDLPLRRASAGVPALYLGQWAPETRRASFRVTDLRQLTAAQEDVRWLDPARLGPGPEDIPPEVHAALAGDGLTAVDLSHPQWREAARFCVPRPGKKRVHLLAVGDVGSTLLMALKLLGGSSISTVGICDLDEKTVSRWTAEMGQISWPWDYSALPEVEAVPPERLFDCDVFLFAATKAIPPVGSAVTDVRMAQYAANRPLVASFARQAREKRFRGLFIVLSDPVDPLCRAAWDGLGLLPEQVHGFGLGVMNARAAYFAKADPRFASFLTEGRSFGPHGRGLTIANSIERYDDALSQELTELAETANLRIRDLGFKPYVAPAIASGAMQLLLTLQGAWHCGSVCLGGIWFGVRCRYTAAGQETEALTLPDPLFQRLTQTQALLREII